MEIGDGYACLDGAERCWGREGHPYVRRISKDLLRGAEGWADLEQGMEKYRTFEAAFQFFN